MPHAAALPLRHDYYVVEPLSPVSSAARRLHEPPEMPRHDIAHITRASAFACHFSSRFIEFSFRLLPAPAPPHAVIMSCRHAVHDYTTPIRHILRRSSWSSAMPSRQLRAQPAARYVCLRHCAVFFTISLCAVK